MRGREKLERKIKVLIVDDSAIVRKVLSELLGQVSDIEVVGTAPDPYVARDKILELHPDVVTLDVEMPRMDGITFLRKLMQYHPLPVVIISSLTPKGSRLGVEALEAGAVDVVPKPGSSLSVKDLGEILCDKIRAAFFCNPQKRRVISRVSNAEYKPEAGLRYTTDKIIAIGASTGGTEALCLILQQMPPDCPGITVVQHMPALFTKAFAERLDQICPMKVKEAEDREWVQPGKVLIAPGDYHMAVHRSGARYLVRLGQGPRVYYQRPSVEVLFQSVARVAGPNAVGVILTGMGADGSKGLKAMRDAGARTIAQDERTSVVFGMPGQAIKLGAAERVLPLERVSSEIICLVSEVCAGSAAAG
jgi:two-component system chemotaxis response regulator CheB